MSRSAIGTKSPHRPQVRRRSRRRISSVSRKPRVVMTPIFGPRRSSSVLVPTVVPCTIDCMPAAPPSAVSPLRKPSASSPRRDGTFAVRNVPLPESSRNRSVKVPPTSTPTMTPRLLMRIALRHGRCAPSPRGEGRPRSGRVAEKSVDKRRPLAHPRASRADPPLAGRDERRLWRERPKTSDCAVVTWRLAPLPSRQVDAPSDWSTTLYRASAASRDT